MRTDDLEGIACFWQYQARSLGNVIGGFAQMLADTSLQVGDAKRLHYAEQIVIAQRELTALYDDLCEALQARAILTREGR